MANTDLIPRSITRGMSSDVDLSWLFCQADAEVSGLRASHGALVEMAQTGAARAGAGTGGIPRRVQGITAKQADAVDRQRNLGARLCQLSQRHQDILWLAYGPRPWTLAPDERQRLGQWYGVALVTLSAARAWSRESGERVEKAGKMKPDDAALKREEVADWYAKGLGHWLRGPAVERETLTAVRAEAERLVAEAWRVWRATAGKAARGKRPPQWDGGSDDLGEEPVDASGDRVSETRVVRYRPEGDSVPLAPTQARRLGS